MNETTCIHVLATQDWTVQSQYLDTIRFDLAAHEPVEATLTYRFPPDLPEQVRSKIIDTRYDALDHLQSSIK